MLDPTCSLLLALIRDLTPDECITLRGLGRATEPRISKFASPLTNTHAAIDMIM